MTDSEKCCPVFDPSLYDDKVIEWKDRYFYYTTCPKCAKKHGHNYVVGFAQVEE